MKRLLLSILAIVCALSAEAEGGIGRGVGSKGEPVVIGYLKEGWSAFVESVEENMEAGDDSLRIAIKTNGLAVAGLIPNIGAEVYLGKNWSVSASWHHAWWHSDKALWYWRTYGGEIAGRKWFGKKAMETPLAGHHLGVYAQMMTYDFLTGRNGILADTWNYAGGVEYGYSFHLNNCLRLDLGIGVGFMGGQYKNYKPMDGHYVWQSTMQRHYFGPTKAEASLVWIIDFRKWGGRGR